MIRIDRLTKSFNDKKIYNELSLQVNDGECVCILGESGSGKTTLLNCIASLTDYEGSISGSGKVAYLFQDARLLPHLTVEKNLQLVNKNGDEIEKWLSRTKMSKLKKRYPYTLSGGEKQRVALARAFLFDGDTLLLDEPFSSLDLKLKIELLEECRTLLRSEKKTSVFVTHDIEEALFIGDRILVLKNGEIVASFENDSSKPYFSETPLRKQLIEILLR